MVSTLAWLDSNRHAEKHEIEARLKALDDLFFEPKGATCSRFDRLDIYQPAEEHEFEAKPKELDDLLAEPQGTEGSSHAGATYFKMDSGDYGDGSSSDEEEESRTIQHALAYCDEVLECLDRGLRDKLSHLGRAADANEIQDAVHELYNWIDGAGPTEERAVQSKFDDLRFFINTILDSAKKQEARESQRTKEKKEALSRDHGVEGKQTDQIGIVNCAVASVFEAVD